ncbi:hypothetical protein ACHAAC_04500 [Aeromicrobium sp. CF4.19]|uniref:hypothetical protein n=1 Tax=Aeromicrobium sp. CF4.19 TaxID=3373082 RepID=UPI003EE722F6
MALFGRRRGTSDRRATRDDLAALREWVTTRQGVEAYVEPPTNFTETTVVLVAADGESIRRRVASAKAAGDFARKAGIPVYDTNRVGFPQRMRDYAVRQKAAQSGRAASAGRSAPARPPAERPLSPSERDAIASLQVSAGADGVSGRPGDDVLRQWWKQARVRSHPDRRGGDRTEWDEVEQAADTLGLTES